MMLNPRNRQRSATARRKSLLISRPLTRQQRFILKESTQDKFQDLNQQLKANFQPTKYSNERIVKTANSYRCNAKSPSRSVDIKRPIMTFDSPNINQEKRAEKLGLQDYIKDLVTSTKKQNQEKISQQFMVKAFNKTWLNLQDKQYTVTTGFQSTLGPRKSSKSLNKPDVKWNMSKQEESNWKQMNHINHYQFPCRKQSKLLKEKYYSNSPEKPRNNSLSWKKIEKQDKDDNGLFYNIKTNDISGNANKLLKRLIGDRQSMKAKQAQLKQRGNNKNCRKITNLRQNPPIHSMNFQIIRGKKMIFNQ